MAVLEILEIPDARLRYIAQPIETIDDSVRQLAADMIETMYEANGIGLAATQLGIDKRILVIDLQERAAPDDEREREEAAEPEVARNPIVVINPEILSVSDDVSIYNEGCLSIPEQYAEVERPARCRVRWLDEQGAHHEEDLDGLMSTCMQHEIDHLNGILFIDHISRLKRNMIVKKLDKLRKKAA